jgi:hypothetical protein
MNIFRLDNDPHLAATMAIDKHVVKMPLESCQLLHTALRTHGFTAEWLYKPFNPKHPSCKWVSETSGNFQWVIRHGLALCDEYTARYGKIHKCRDKIVSAMSHSYVIPSGPETKQLLAMPEQFKNDDVVHSYKLYYAGAKFRFAKWKTNEPYWWDEYRFLVQQNGLEVVNDKNDGVKV